ncbi:MAG: DUF2269 family protein [Gaiellaceae bacterium]
MSRDTWLVLHIFGVVIFLGNIIVTAVWKVLADRTRDPAVVSYAQRLVTITDIAFTATGATLIAVSGGAMADDFGGVTGEPWLTWGVVLFVASGVIWVTVLIPIQVLQSRLTRTFDDEIPNGYWRLARLWYVFGALATALPLVNIYLMVAKPG